MLAEVKSHKALYRHVAPSSCGVTRPFCQRSTELAQVASTISLKDETFSCTNFYSCLLLMKIILNLVLATLA